MSRLSRLGQLRIAIAVLIAAAAPSLAHAQEELKHIPASAVAVVRVSSLEQAAGSVSDVLTQLGQSSEEAIANMRRNTARDFGLGEPEKLAAIDTTQPMYVIAVARKVPKPTAMLVKLKDEAKFRQAVLGEPDAKVEKSDAGNGFQKLSTEKATWFVSKRDGWMLYTREEEVAKALTGKSLAEIADLPRARELLFSGTLSGMINMAVLNQAFKDEIEKAFENAEKGIDSIPNENLGDQPEMSRKLLHLFAKAAKTGVQDGDWAAGSISISRSGVTAQGDWNVKSGSASDTFLSKFPPHALDALELLTPNADIYAAFRIGSDTLKVFSGLVEESKLTDEAKQSAKQGLEALIKAELGTIAFGFTMPSTQSAGVQVNYIIEAKDAKLVADSARYSAKANNNQKNPLFTQKIDYKPGAENYKGHSIDLTTQKYEWAAVPDAGQQFAQSIIKRIFGGDELQVRSTALPKIFALATGNDQKHLQQLVDGIESGKGVAGLDQGFSKGRDALDSKANFVMLVNAPDFVAHFGRLIRDLSPLDMFLGRFNFGLQPPSNYAGFSFATRPQGARFKLNVPIEQPKGIKAIFSPSE